MTAESDGCSSYLRLAWTRSMLTSRHEGDACSLHARRSVSPLRLGWRLAAPIPLSSSNSQAWGTRSTPSSHNPPRPRPDLPLDALWLQAIAAHQRAALGTPTLA